MLLEHQQLHKIIIITHTVMMELHGLDRNLVPEKRLLIYFMIKHHRSGLYTDQPTLIILMII